MVQTNFNYGELDPLMMGRSDIKAYTGGCKTLSNWSLLTQGGIKRRPGLAYVQTQTTNGAVYRLAPFDFGLGQAYLLVFSDARLDIYKPDGTLCQTLTSMAWSASQIWALNWTQSGDTMILCHPSIATKKLLRTGSTSFTVTDFAFEVDGVNNKVYQPYYKYAASDNLLTPSATTGSITLTLSASYWQSYHVNRVVRHKGKQIKINSITSGTVANGTCLETLASATGASDWDEQAFAPEYGYPQCACFHENRLWFGGSLKKPSGLWASKTAAFFNFDYGTAKDDESIDVAVESNQGAEVKHMISNRHLQLFTSVGEFFVPTSFDNRPITPTGIIVRRQTPYGCSSLRPAVLDGATLFVQRTGKVVREFLYDYYQQSYGSNATSLMSTHLLTNPVDIAVQYGATDRPEQYAFIVNTDGSMAVYHSVRAEKLAGWVPWTTNGKFLSVAVVNDTTYVLVSRTINSATVYMLERFDNTMTLDCAKTATGSALTTWSGFSHLSGNTVSVTSDTYYLGEYAVAAGSLTTPFAVNSVQVGMNYSPSGETTPPVMDVGNGSITAEPRRISRVNVLLNSALAVSINGTDMIVRQVTDDLSLAPAAKTSSELFFVLGYSRRPTVTFKQDIPLPLTIMSLALEVTF